MENKDQNATSYVMDDGAFVSGVGSVHEPPADPGALSTEASVLPPISLDKPPKSAIGSFLGRNH